MPSNSDITGKLLLNLQLANRNHHRSATVNKRCQNYLTGVIIPEEPLARGPPA